ncbi:MAG: SMI1/KNR4 family protein [Cyanobacteria bacterium J06627_28]
MEEIWLRITVWIESNAPHLLEVLQPGASEAQISELESSLSIVLPDDVKALYLLCNGQSVCNYGIINGNEFLSLERIKDEWSIWKDLLDADEFAEHDNTESNRIDPEIRNTWWSSKWIPLTYNGSGDHDCLDLDPTERGTIGQIITMWHDDDERKVIASGIRAWLQQYSEQLEAGQLVFSEEYNGIVSVDDV